jgi:hypothetical protein
MSEVYQQTATDDKEKVETRKKSPAHPRKNPVETIINFAIARLENPELDLFERALETLRKNPADPTHRVTECLREAGEDPFERALATLRNCHEGMKTARRLICLQTEQFGKLLKRAQAGDRQALTSAVWEEEDWFFFSGEAARDEEGFIRAVRELLRDEDRKRAKELLAAAPTREMLQAVKAKYEAMERPAEWGPAPTDELTPYILSAQAFLEAAWESPVLWIEQWFDAHSMKRVWLACRKDTRESALTHEVIDWPKRKIEHRPFMGTQEPTDILDALAKVHQVSLNRVYSRPDFKDIPRSKPDAQRLAAVIELDKRRGKTAKKKSTASKK